MPRRRRRPGEAGAEEEYVLFEMPTFGSAIGRRIGKGCAVAPC